MKIVMLDAYTTNPGDLSWDCLKVCGDLTVYDKTPTDALTIERLQEADIAITNKTPITRAVLDACPSIRFISVLATCAEMEREAIAFRLNSGLKRYKENGGKVGRKVGSIKTKEKKQEEYAKVLRCLKQGKSIRDTSVLCGVSVSTVFRVKREFGV